MTLQERQQNEIEALKAEIIQGSEMKADLQNTINDVDRFITGRNAALVLVIKNPEKYFKDIDSMEK